MNDPDYQEISRSASIHHMSRSQVRPELPPLPPSANDKPSELYKTVMMHSYYPPLMQRTSWTRAAPFKEQHHHRGPSDSIANNYSLKAQNLRLRDFAKVYQPVTIAVRRGKNIQESSKVLSVESKKKKMKSSLKDKEKTDGIKSVGSSTSTATKKASMTFSESRPMSPEEQINIMLQEEQEKQNKEDIPSPLDLERYYYYLTNGIPKDMIAEEEEEVMVRISKLISNTLLTNPALEPLMLVLIEEKEHG